MNPTNRNAAHRKLTISRILSLALFALALAACDQIPGRGGSGIAIIDLNAIAKATGQEEIIQQQAQAARDELNVQLQEAATSLEAQLNEEREKLGDSPTQEQTQQFQQLAAQAQQQYAQAQQQAQQQAQLFQNNLVMALREKIQPVVAEVARARGASVVYLSDMTLFWFEPQADLTDEVIAKLRADPSILEDTLADAPVSETTGSDPKPATEAGN